MSLSPSQMPQPRPPLLRPPSQGTLFLAAGLICIGYRIAGPLLGAHPDNSSIGFALACFGLWQGAERRRPRTSDPEDDSCTPTRRPRPSRRTRSQQHRARNRPAPRKEEQR